MVCLASVGISHLLVSKAVLSSTTAIVEATFTLTRYIIHLFHVNSFAAGKAAVGAAPINLHVSGGVAVLGASSAFTLFTLAILYNILLVKVALVKHLLACPAYPVILLKQHYKTR